MLSSAESISVVVIAEEERRSNLYDPCYKDCFVD